MILYRVVRTIVAGLARGLFRIKVVGSERVPASGAYVIAPSHRSLLDAFFAALITRRRVRFMAKEELWKIKLLGRLVEALGAFPVSRGAADRAALREAMACVEDGEPLVIFPEGTRRSGPRITDLHDGAAYVAARRRVPVVPVGIAGSEEILAKGAKLPKLRRVVLVVGEPIEAVAPDGEGGPVPRSAVRDLTAGIEVALQKAFDDARASREQ